MTATRRIATAALIALLLAGCGSEQPLVAKPAADTRTHPVVAARQATGILDRIDSALGSADPARVGGPYLEIRTARRKQAQARKLTSPTPPAPGRTRLVVPSSTGWPRFFLAVGQRTGQSTPSLRLLLSQQARAPYQLWADLVMLPGATLPEMPPVDPGAEALAPSGPADLLRSPLDALTRYADVLTRGPASPDAKSFAPNTFTTQVTGQQQTDRTGLAKIATVTATHAVVPDTVFAVRTADGGALVVGRLQQKVSIVVKPDAGTVKVSDLDLAALAGRSVFRKSVTRVSAELVALYVPPAGSTLIDVIAAEKADLTVTGS